MFSNSACGVKYTWVTPLHPASTAAFARSMHALVVPHLNAEERTRSAPSSIFNSNTADGKQHWPCVHAAPPRHTSHIEHLNAAQSGQDRREQVRRPAPREPTGEKGYMYWAAWLCFPLACATLCVKLHEPVQGRSCGCAARNEEPVQQSDLQYKCSLAGGEMGDFVFIARSNDALKQPLSFSFCFTTTRAFWWHFISTF